MKTHLAVSAKSIAGGTLTTTLCGFMSGKSEDGMNSTEKREDVTCAKCAKIIASPKHWRHRKYIAKTFGKEN